jgi:hypothetical protein
MIKKFRKTANMTGKPEVKNIPVTGVRDLPNKTKIYAS